MNVDVINVYHRPSPWLRGEQVHVFKNFDRQSMERLLPFSKFIFLSHKVAVTQAATMPPTTKIEAATEIRFSGKGKRSGCSW